MKVWLRYLSLCVVLCGFAVSVRAEEQHFDLVLVHGKLVNQANTLRVNEGDDVSLVWHSDQALELHLHGFDVLSQVSATSPTTMSFKASATGRFPISLHAKDAGHAHGTVLYLEVYPQ